MAEMKLPDFDKGDGLIPVIVQDFKTLRVLMMAYMNRESYLKTLELGEMVYFSRSRERLWHKGEVSGNTQKMMELRVDCDRDTLLALVDQRGGAACHTGRESCFYHVVDSLTQWREEGELLFDPNDVYKKNRLK